MKQTSFITLAVLAIGFLLYLNFAPKKEPGFSHRIILTDKAPPPIGPYEQAVLTGNTLFVSGQIALNPDGAFDTSSIENEFKQVAKNISAILEAAKMDICDVVSVRVYMTDLKKFKELNDVYMNSFRCADNGGFKPGNVYPARETVQVSALPKGAHIEISVVAVR